MGSLLILRIRETKQNWQKTMNVFDLYKLEICFIWHFDIYKISF